MQYLDLKKTEIELKGYRHRTAEEQDCSISVKGDSIIKINGKIVLAYFDSIVDKQLDRMIDVIKKMTFTESMRSGGLKTTSRIFGFKPRNQIRNAPCSSTSFAFDEPELHKVVAEGSKLASKFYFDNFPELASAHMNLAKEKVKSGYLIEDTMFTSGIVNKNNPLKYHFDSGNFSNVCSAMFGFKKNIAGGWLCLPELDVKLPISNNSLLLFDGQNLLHGVSPITRTKVDSYRYTVVYYSLKQMWNCEVITDEITRLRSIRSRIEKSKVSKNEIV